jgi:selenocysteine-specific elongation factor|tara:strand:+ start:1024 stop:2454 length:1431 start_codon:yes stop_codon:yes gene_type:complete
VDVNKGIQTQTAECIVVGEITCSVLIVVLNKVDLIPCAVRDEKVEQVKRRLKKTFSATKFKDCVMTSVAVRPGSDNMVPCDETPIGVDALVAQLLIHVPELKPRRTGNFLCAIDHCFPVRGQGTVLTGTVLSGRCHVGEEVEILNLKLTKRVKGLQVFKRPVQSCIAGDRVGMCITQLDPTILERGLVAMPGTVPTFVGAVVSAEKIRFYKGTVQSKMKFHVTVGHATVMATAEFFGQIPTSLVTNATQALSSKIDPSGMPINTGGVENCALRETPEIPSDPQVFSVDREYVYCTELSHTETLKSCRTPTEDIGSKPDSGSATVLPLAKWALLRFDHPISCPLGSIYIASRFGTDTNFKKCRLAFHGQVVHPMPIDHSPISLNRIKVFRLKQRQGTVDRVHDAYNLIGKGMFKKETNISAFHGMSVRTSCGEIGTIEGSFGKNGKFMVHFKNGVPSHRDGCGPIRLHLESKCYVMM